MTSSIIIPHHNTGARLCRFAQQKTSPVNLESLVSTNRKERTYVTGSPMAEVLPVPDYIEENVSTKVVKIIQSYVGIVNKMVWRKF